MYTAIFFWAHDDTASWSTEVDTLDKDAVAKALLDKGNHNSLAWAIILVVENGKVSETIGSNGRPEFGLSAPKIVCHWSALNGDF